jgi:hypothetical protein
MVLAPEPAAQEARHEAVAGAQHIVDLDREALADNAVLDARRNGVGKDDAAHGAALQDDGSLGDGAHLAQSGERVLLAAGNMHFFFRADDEIAIGENRLQAFRDLVRFDVALLARGMAGETPEIGPVVDVENDAPAMRLGDGHRLLLRGMGVRACEMRAGDKDGAARADEVGIDIGFRKRAVGAIIAIEDEREGLVVLDREQDE